MFSLYVDINSNSIQSVSIINLPLSDEPNNMGVHIEGKCILIPFKLKKNVLNVEVNRIS
jgi:hypothetical protein